MLDFRTTEVQAVLFTPPVNYRGSRFLSHFMAKWGDLFDGEPLSLEPPEGFPVQLAGTFPRAILRSEDSRLHLRVSIERLDFQVNVGDSPETAPGEHFQRATALFAEYVDLMAAEVNRVAGLVTRVALNEHAARTVSRRFCRDEWVEGPINRPSVFEIHTLKKYRLADRFDVNSWFRCKAGTSEQKRPDQRQSEEDDGELKGILVEQELNTQQDGRLLTKEEVRAYYSLAPDELDGIFRLYFAEGAV